MKCFRSIVVGSGREKAVRGGFWRSLRFKAVVSAKRLIIFAEICREKFWRKENNAYLCSCDDLPRGGEEVTRLAHNQENGGSNPPSATLLQVI